ncbi:metallophosphoesterase [Antrihabitans sp. YC2-6]|uniref:metallophosphoesterase family protein n=1 Tax=Antrihabitans sp. YC2-6 TaxID=2799498 RepID=UPI0018F60291|nr:metallophosphoesterase [Antrihabitans sp. YC2-6]MBJ8343570.1 metallophosphoesterase [Antrihabitans sp. YC2-6]
MAQAVAFDVLSDTQADMVDLDTALSALAEFGTADALFVNGDLTANGRVRQYRELFAHLAAAPHPPALFTIGNHDFYNHRTNRVSIDRFLQFTGMPGLYSAHRIGDVKVLRLGTLDGSEKSGHYVVLGADQLAWLAAELDTNVSAPVVVLSHHPLPHTVSGTYDDPVTQAPKMYSRDYAEADQLLTLLEAHPEVLFLSGHSHWNLSRADWFTRARGFAAANTGAVQTGFGPDGRGGERPHDGPFNQGLRIVVEGAAVRVHALDFVTRAVVHTVEFSADKTGASEVDGVTWVEALTHRGAAPKISRS